VADDVACERLGKRVQQAMNGRESIKGWVTGYCTVRLVRPRTGGLLCAYRHARMHMPRVSANLPLSPANLNPSAVILL
jgi:hypothetical protein